MSPIRFATLFVLVATQPWQQVAAQRFRRPTPSPVESPTPAPAGRPTAQLTIPPVVQEIRECPQRNVRALPNFDFSSLLFAPYFALLDAPSLLNYPGTEPFCLRRVYQLARLQIPPPIPALVAFPFLFQDFFVGQTFFDVTTSSNVDAVNGTLEEFKLKTVQSSRLDFAELVEGPSFVPNSEVFIDSFILAGGLLSDLEDPSVDLDSFVRARPDRLEWFFLSSGLPRKNSGNGCVPITEGYTVYSIDPLTSEDARSRLVEVVASLGYDTSRLREVVQEGCAYPPIPERDFTRPPSSAITRPPSGSDITRPPTGRDITRPPSGRDITRPPSGREFLRGPTPTIAEDPNV